MRHPALRMLGSLRTAAVSQIEDAVDLIIAEAEMAGDYGYDGERASRAEALAILGHELRRRATPDAD